MEYETITGAEALDRMRRLRLINDATFMLMHLSCDLKTRECGEMIKHDRCRLRGSLPERTFKINVDHYLPYEDLDTGEPKMCFKKLIRYVAFPPDYEILKVTWFKK
jgi:hypothetical protein